MADENETTNVSGGVNIRGNASFGGDLVQGDKIGGDKVQGNKTVVSAGRDAVMGNQTIGMTAEDVAKLFDSIYKKIDQKPAEDRPDIKDAVDTIKKAAEQEAIEGQQPDDKEVKAASQALAVAAPDLLKDVADVALATMANPAAGVLTIVRKVLQKVQASRAAGS